MTSYKVYWDAGLQNEEYSLLTTVTDLTYTKSDSLDAGTLYSFRVSAENVVGEGS